MHLQARMRAHEWVNEVEQPVTTETVVKETQDKPGGEDLHEEEKKDGGKEGEEEATESDPRSVEVI